MENSSSQNLPVFFFN